MTKPNKKEECDFDVIYKNEKYHIFEMWIQPNGYPAFYEGTTDRNGVSCIHTFTPDEIPVPEITEEKPKEAP